MGAQQLTGPEVAVGQPIWVDEHEDKNRFVVRLGLPCINPGKDLDVSIDDHLLTICVRGPVPFRDVFALPDRTDFRDAAATYRDGILEVSVGWQEGPTARKIEVLSLSSVR